MEMLVEWLLKLRIEEIPTEIANQFEGVRKLRAIDSTVIQLHKLLADDFESTHDNQAVAKAHVVATVIDGSANSVKLTGQIIHVTGPVKTIGRWVKDCLLLMDLAYLRLQPVPPYRPAGRLLHPPSQNPGRIPRSKHRTAPVGAKATNSPKSRSNRSSAG